MKKQRATIGAERWHSGEGWHSKGQESNKRGWERKAREDSGKLGVNNITETKFGDRGEKAVVKSLHGTDR